MFRDVFVANQHSYPARCEMRWICQMAKKTSDISPCMSGFWPKNSKDGFPYLIHRGFSQQRQCSLCWKEHWQQFQLELGHWFPALNWLIKAWHQMGVRNGVRHGVRYVMTCHEEFRLHIGYETPDEEATLLKLTADMEWSKVQDSGWSIHKTGFWKSLKWSPQFEALGVPNFAVAHLASFASTESGFFMICFRFLDAVDSCDIRLEASLDTFGIFWKLLLFVGGGCALLVGANCQALLPQNNLHWSSILVSNAIASSNCFLHYKCTYIHIIYTYRIYYSIISHWKRLHHGRFLPMWPAAIRGRKSRDLIASEPDAWLWPFCRQRFTECCGSNIPPLLNHREAKLDMRGVRRKSLYFVSGFNIDIQYIH